MRNNIFSLNRFGLLLRQNFKHNYKLFTLSMVGACGGIFILFLVMQIVNNSRPIEPNKLSATFIFLFLSLGVIYSGTSFPDLRTKEKSNSFLLVPASTFEKFVLEFLSRIVLFAIVMPLIFWIIYLIEGHFAQVIFKDFHLPNFGLPQNLKVHSNSGDAEWPYLFISLQFLLIFVIPFTGASIFTKHPLIKTLFGVAIIFFIHLLLVYFFMEVMNFKAYGGPLMSVFNEKITWIDFFTIYSMILNIALLAVAYFKLKEKEV